MDIRPLRPLEVRHGRRDARPVSDAPMNTAILIAVIVAWVGLMMFMAWALINLRTQLDRKIDELAMERDRRRRTEKQALALVEKVTPLIKQTDWMTGAWHGQFSTLQRLEADRNTAVVTARRALWEIPLVADHIKKTYGESK
jgi:predicted transcriptional regulator